MRLGRWLQLIGAIIFYLAISAFAEGKPLRQADTERDPLTVALDYTYNLEFSAARQILDAWLQQHPTDLRALNYLADVVLDQQLLNEGLFSTAAYTNNGEAFRKRTAFLPPGFEDELLAILRKAQTLAEERLKQNSQDEDALYWAGMTHGTRAEFYFTIQRSHLAALHEGLGARKYHLRLHKLDPNYIDALFVLGTADYVAGSLPWYFKAFASLTGFRGSRSRGLAELKRVSEEGHWARAEAKAVLVALYRREKMYPEALTVLQDLARSYPRNFLIPEEMARLYQVAGDWRSAAQVYDVMTAKFRAREPGYASMPAATILYKAGKAHEQLGEWQEALKLYETAGKLPESSDDSHRANLAAADLYLRLNRRVEALRDYQRVGSGRPEH